MIVRCSGCGAQNTIDYGYTVRCEYCGSIIGSQSPPIQSVDVEQTLNTQPVINNYYTSPNTDTNVVIGRKRRSCLFDCFMILITCGLWIIWMIVRR